MAALSSNYNDSVLEGTITTVYNSLHAYCIDNYDSSARAAPVLPVSVPKINISCVIVPHRPQRKIIILSIHSTRTVRILS